MARSDDLCFTPVTELVGAIRDRRVSPVELTDAVLDRIERVNPKLNAFTLVLADEARAAARRAEEAIQKRESLGLLHGIPLTIKDVTSTKGIRTTLGSKAFANYVPRSNGIPVDRLLGAGAICLGKTTTPELGNKGVTESPLSGTTNNPWKLSHTAGGSSGGAAAAVAAGLSPLAEGSDGGGSIRIPASCCGVVGFKPSLGRVPIHPLVPVFNTLVHQGPITRTVPDAALMLTALAGPDDRDPYSIPETGIDYLVGLEGASVTGVRVAYSRDLGLGPVDPRVTARTDAAARLFADRLGARIEEKTPDLPNPEEIMLTIWSTSNAAVAIDHMLPRVGREELDPALLQLVDRAEQLSALDFYRAAYVARSQFYQRMMLFFQDYDLLITPTITTPPFPHPGWQQGPSEVAGQPINPLLGWVLTYPFNLTGQPAISVPCGFTDDGLPIGLQIVGRRQADLTVLRAAAAYEEAAPWADRRPPIA